MLILNCHFLAKTNSSKFKALMFFLEITNFKFKKILKISHKTINFLFRLVDQDKNIVRKYNSTR